MKPAHFRHVIIRPTLKYLGLWSPSAENLLLGTALVESGLFYMRQHGGGPALGFYQIEPATHKDIEDRFLLLDRNADLHSKVLALKAPVPSAQEQLISNLTYVTAIARLKYLMDPQPLPAADDVWQLAQYWKRVYNSELGRGHPRDFQSAYEPHHEPLELGA